MKQIRMLAQYYVDLMMKLGLVRFSLLLALALVVLAIVVQMAVTMVLHGRVEQIDVIRSIFFGLLITPWAVYFLSVVVEQLEESRQRLSRLVQKLEEMRERDLKLNVQLKDNISQLNQEIADREKAEAERQSTFEQLKVRSKSAKRRRFSLNSNPPSYVPFWMPRRIWFFIATKIKSFPAAIGQWNCSPAKAKNNWCI